MAVGLFMVSPDFGAQFTGSTRWLGIGVRPGGSAVASAQDFEAASGLGGDGRSISTIDPSGIALAAIQELNRKTEALTAANSRLQDMGRLVDSNQREIALLKEPMAALVAALDHAAANQASRRTEVKR